MIEGVAAPTSGQALSLVHVIREGAPGKGLIQTEAGPSRGAGPVSPPSTASLGQLPANKNCTHTTTTKIKKGSKQNLGSIKEGLVKFVYRVR